MGSRNGADVMAALMGRNTAGRKVTSMTTLAYTNTTVYA
ncbi:hypothetical protein MPS_3217 [Mycobacterium pseudoshottsii JCM 15466]|nr:hypothetical protein MMSP_0620 [Mycobacterium sp. 012931]RFZ71190.1 hypothetical protein DL240490_00804 [Mycobacterium marinum]GAQ36590.1 hypothetical protein MPS_3217 [Mycobacterium pseudoshottsii JCM 15466]